MNMNMKNYIFPALLMNTQNTVQALGSCFLVFDGQTTPILNNAHTILALRAELFNYFHNMIGITPSFSYLFIEYPNILGYTDTKKIYQMSGIKETINTEHLVKHYHASKNYR